MLTYSTPYQAYAPLSIARVSLKDGFFHRPYALLKNVTIRDIFDKLENDGAIANFETVARGESAPFKGCPWHDGLLYETIRAASDLLLQEYDPALDKRLDGYIAIIIKAQAADPGRAWINTYTTLTNPDNRWGLKTLGFPLVMQHNMYNMGCLTEAGMHHYRATGKTTLLSAAARMVALAASDIGLAPKKHMIPEHPIFEEAAFELYALLAREPDLAKRLDAPIDADSVLALARYTIDGRGHYEGRESLGAYAQDHAPYDQQHAIAGHAVRATLFWTGVTAGAAVTSDKGYLRATKEVWADMVRTKLYISGSAGAMREEEKFGDRYYLPNDGYMEICAPAGAMFYHHAMALLTGESAPLDDMENALINGVLPGFSLSGDKYFYESPLVTNGTHRRWTWHACPCCPPMLAKSIAMLPALIYSANANSINVNLYASSDATVDIGGARVRVEQKTQYPFDENVTLRVSADQETAFTLRLRVPAWCRAATAAIDGAPVREAPRDGWITISRAWRGMAVITLTLSMPVERMLANPAVESDRGRIAIRRGPVLYCVESIDNDGVAEVTLPPHPSFTIESLPGGFADLALALSFSDASGVRRLAIPYYLYDNRCPAQMAVWQKQDGLKDMDPETWNTLYRNAEEVDFS